MKLSLCENDLPIPVLVFCVSKFRETQGLLRLLGFRDGSLCLEMAAVS
jgi:hypothetical protein